MHSVRASIKDSGCLKLTGYRLCGIHRGSKFLKSWMEFLEENADLRYPDLDDLLRDE